MTKVLTVRSAQGAYEVVIGAGVLRDTGHYLSQHGVKPGTQLFLVTDQQVAGLGYPALVAESCRQAGYSVCEAVVAPGDESKSLETAKRLYQEMLAAGVRRSGILLAVGGGMVGDLGGFVAATYQRGIRYVQIPTTLLAHDSSIGGKVAINLPQAKNIVGAFHAPLAVLYDVEALASLPQREWAGGMAEVIKHGIIGDPQLFAELESHPVVAYPGSAHTEAFVARAAGVKVHIVEQDEHESGLRMLLNVGHTVGHAVEQLSNYTIHHGEAVAIGLRVESELACARGWLSPPDKERIVRTLAAHGLPVHVPNMPFADVVATLNLDKKHDTHGWTFALPRQIGEVAIARDVTYEELALAWAQSQPAGG